jgi:hypothetical protein
MFAEAEAARLLGVSQSTLHWWLDGGTYRNRHYRPVIRSEATGGRSVTWAEFVEAGLLREYRRTHGVALSELRTVIDRLRDEYGSPYPLAHHCPFVGPGRQLLVEVQQDIGPCSTEQLQALLVALDVRLDEDLLRDIDEVVPPGEVTVPYYLDDSFADFWPQPGHGCGGGVGGRSL